MAKTLELQITKVKCVRRTTNRQNIFGIPLETDPDSLDFAAVITAMPTATLQPFEKVFLGNQYESGREQLFNPATVVMQTLVQEGTGSVNFAVNLLLAEKDDGGGFENTISSVVEKVVRDLGTTLSFVILARP